MLNPANRRTLAAGGLGKELPVPYFKQCQREWCWAGCARMVLGYYKPTATKKQCDLADWLFTNTTCCATPGAAHCNRPCDVSDVSKLYTHLGLSSLYQSGQISFQDIVDEIEAERPIQIGFDLGYRNHLALVIGWLPPQKVIVNDPDLGSMSIKYSDLVKAHGKGVWCATWTGIE